MKKFINEITIKNKTYKQELTQKDILEILDSVLENRIKYSNGLTKNDYISSINLLVDEIIFQTDKLNTKFLKKLSAIYRHLIEIDDITQETKNDIFVVYQTIKGAIQHFETHKRIDKQYKELENQKLKLRN